jgi:hypothetical protein
MKYKLFPLWMLFSIVLSCSKESRPKGVAALTLVNAVPDSYPYLIPSFGVSDQMKWGTGIQLRYGVSTMTGAYSGLSKVSAYHFPDTTTHDIPVYDMTLDLPVGTMHTLFITGTVAAADTIFTTDVFPYHPPSDSSMGVRLVNASKGSAPVSVNISGQAQGSEVSSLAYKGLTSFINYPARATTSDYTFEFRDAASGTLIASYVLSGASAPTYNTRRYRNFTIALIGTPGDPATLQVILIEAYSAY